MEQNPSCTECGSMTDHEHLPGCPMLKTSIVDKRGDRNAVPSEPPEPEMDPKEAAALLAQQAAAEAAEEPSPYGGGGFEGETDEEALQPVQTMFLVVVHNDGTAWAHHDLEEINKYDPLMVASPKQMYRACAEIMLDVEAAQVAEATLTALENRTATIAAAARKQQREGIQNTVREKTAGRGRG